MTYKSFLLFALINASALCALCTAADAATNTQAPLEIKLSHASDELDSLRTEQLERLLARFNREQKNIRVNLALRRSEQELTQINLLSEEARARLLAQKIKFKPLYSLVSPAQAQKDALLDYDNLDTQGRRLALPWTFATPVLYLNKALFRQAGLNAEEAPKTWAELQETALKLQAAGIDCPFTSARPAWIHIDNLSAWHASKIRDTNGTFKFNDSLQIKHIALLSSWHKSHLFLYFGRRDEADQHFAAGECAMLTSSSSLDAALRAQQNATQNTEKKFEFTVAPLPHYDEASSSTNPAQRTLADGASLWILAGLSQAENKAMTHLIAFLTRPDVQASWAQESAYLVSLVSPNARNENKKTSQGKRNSATNSAPSNVWATPANTGIAVAYAQISGRAKPAGSRLGATNAAYSRVSRTEPSQTLLDEALEAVWAGQKSAKTALDQAAFRVNHPTTAPTFSTTARLSTKENIGAHASQP
ncbi:MAG: extracellular solute-binding protein [Pseudomonadota bacterium]